MEIRINLTSFQINFRSKDVSFRYVYILDIKILIAARIEARITKECCEVLDEGPVVQYLRAMYAVEWRTGYRLLLFALSIILPL